MELMTKRVLVLNKLWQPVHVSSLKKAIKLLTLVDENMNDDDPNAWSAQVIDPVHFETYTWKQWSEFLPQDGELAIHSARRAWRIPETILLNNYDSVPNHNRQKFSRRQIHRRDNYQCQYCGCRPGTEELTIDHVIPKSHGGDSSWLNCVLACVKCNSRKANRTPEQANMAIQGWKPVGKRRMPYKPKFGLFKTDKIVIPTSWKRFISEAYWNVPLDNDEDEADDE